jgi:hypothetical protein
MADQTSTFAVALEDGTSNVAQDAASALEHLKESLTSSLGELGEMNRALRNLKAGGMQGTAQFKALTDQVKAQKAAIAATQSSYIQLGGTFRRMKPQTDSAAGGLAELKDLVKQMPGPLNGLVGKLGNLRGMLGAGVLAVGAVAFAAALAAVAVAAVAAAAALFRYSVAASGARRAERLQLEGLTRVRNFYGIAAGKASDLQSAIDKVSDSSSLGRDKVGELAQGLYRSNLRGAALEQALEGVAIATDAAGEAQGAFYKQMFMGAGRYGGNTKKVLDDVRARFGDVARARALGWDSQVKRMRENFARIFSGLNLEKLLAGIKQVTDLFSQTTATGRALKTIVEALFQPLADFVGGEGLLVKRFVQGLVIGALILTVGVLKVRNALKQTFGDSDILRNIDMQRVAIGAGVVVVGALAGAVAGLTLAFAGLAAGAAVVAAQIAVPALVMGYLIQRVRGAVAYLRSLDWGEVAANLINGLAQGIRNGAGIVVAAVRELGAKSMKALKEKLQIFSPSRVFRGYGVEVPRGLAGGVRAGTGHAVAAVRTMAERAEDAYASPAGGSEGGAGTGRAASLVVTIQQLIVQAASGEPRAVGEAVEDAMARVLERVAIQMGARPVM